MNEKKMTLISKHWTKWLLGIVGVLLIVILSQIIIDNIHQGRERRYEEEKEERERKEKEINDLNLQAALITNLMGVDYAYYMNQGLYNNQAWKEEYINFAKSDSAVQWVIEEARVRDVSLQFIVDEVNKEVLANCQKHTQFVNDTFKAINDDLYGYDYDTLKSQLKEGVGSKLYYKDGLSYPEYVYSMRCVWKNVENNDQKNRTGYRYICYLTLAGDSFRSRYKQEVRGIVVSKADDLLSRAEEIMFWRATENLVENVEEIQEYLY